MLKSHAAADEFLASNPRVTGCAHLLGFRPPVMLCGAHSEDGLLCIICSLSHTDGQHVEGRPCEVCKAAVSTRHPTRAREVDLEVLLPDASVWRFVGRLNVIGAALCGDCAAALGE